MAGRGLVDIQCSVPGRRPSAGGSYCVLETFMGVDQRTGEGSKPRIPRVVSKSDRDHGTATTDNRNLGLTPAVSISRSNLSLSLYPIQGPQWGTSTSFINILTNQFNEM